MSWRLTRLAKNWRDGLHWFMRFASMQILLARKTRRIRQLEEEVAELTAGAKADAREIDGLRGQIEGHKLEIESLHAAHDRLLERTKAETALHSLHRIRYEEGARRRGEDDADAE